MTTIKFDGITKLDTFLEPEDSSRLFKELIGQITWMRCDWGDSVCAVSYMYSKRERDLTSKPALDDLITIIETVLETKVSKMWAWCYGDGNEHMCYRTICSGENLLHITIGTTRKLYIKNDENEVSADTTTGRIGLGGSGASTKMFRMKHGDAVYVPKNTNTPRQHYMIPANNGVSSCALHLCFVIAEPYSFRYRDTAFVHFLGEGDIEITYDTRVHPDGLPANTTITMLPEVCVPANSNPARIEIVRRTEPGAAFNPTNLRILQLLRAGT